MFIYCDMRSSCSINLLIFGVSCLLEFHASSEICSGNQYTVTDADGKFLKCQACATCHEGYGLKPKCGSQVQSPVENVSCEQCPSGTFSNKYDSGPCYKCQVCDEHQVVISYCNSQADTNCSQTCVKGFYFARDVSQSCHKCSYCCDDDKDEEQLDCVRQGLKKNKQHCSHRVDKNCDPAGPPTDISSPSSNGKKQLDLGTTLAIIFGPLIGVAVVVFVVWAVWKKIRSSGQGQISKNGAPDTSLGDAALSEVTTTLSQEQNRNITSQNAALHSSTIGSTTPRPSAVPNLGYVSSKPGTPQPSPKMVEGQQAQEQNGNVTSQDAALHSPTTGSTTPRLSAVSNLGYVSSKPGTPQPSPKMVEGQQGQIKIVQQPKSQNQTEGSRVEFSCECQLQGNCQVWYQWLKDDTELQQQNNASLFLDSVKMPDFGCYRCSIHVTHKGDHREAVKSEPAVLEVAPCEGKRLKYLRELEVDNLGTRKKIAILLEDETPGLGGYRQIAFKYGMEDYEVKGLKNSPHPGQDVMDFLQASKPDLTIYSFCKTLKEDNMKRLDIVRVLEDHLSIEKESN